MNDQSLAVAVEGVQSLEQNVCILHVSYNLYRGVLDLYPGPLFPDASLGAGNEDKLLWIHG